MTVGDVGNGGSFSSFNKIQKYIAVGKGGGKSPMVWKVSSNEHELKF